MRASAHAAILATVGVAAGCAGGAPRGASAPPPSPAAPTALSIHRHEGYYDITGASVAELRAAMRRLGPAAGNEERDAVTVWSLEWTYGQRRTPDGCALRDVRVTLTVTITLPRWRPPADVAPHLVEAWHTYLTQLQVHEAGHEAIAEEYAHRLVSALAALRRDTCDAVWDAAARTATRLVQEGRAKNRTYDLETNHGQTQGAILTP